MFTAATHATEAIAEQDEKLPSRMPTRHTLRLIVRLRSAKGSEGMPMR
jgi:hypothetical protein